MIVQEIGPDNWAYAKPWCEAWERSKHGHHTVSEIIANLRGGEWSLWGVFDLGECIAVYATRVYRARGDMVLEIPMMIGRRAQDWWRAADEQVEQEARSFGCARVRLIGRKGWARVTRGRYEPVGVIIERKVGHGPG